MKPSEYLKDHWWRGGGVVKQYADCIAAVVLSPRAKTGIDSRVWVEVLKEVLGVSSLTSIFNWNDSPERTLEEVLVVARKAENLIEKGMEDKWILN